MKSQVNLGVITTNLDNDFNVMKENQNIAVSVTRPKEELEKLIISASDLVKEKKYTEAIQALERAIALAGSDREKEELQIEKASLLLLMKENEVAKKILEDIKNQSIDAQIKVAARQKIYMACKLDGTMDEYVANLELKHSQDPCNIEILKELSEIYGSVAPNQIKRVLYLETLVSLSDDISIMTELSQIYVQQKTYEKAIVICDKMAQKDSSHRGEHLLRKASIYVMAGQAEEAEQTCDDIRNIAQDTENAKLMARIGTIYHANGKLQKALEVYRAGQSMTTDSFRRDRLSLESCRILFELGRPAEARLELEKLARESRVSAVRNQAEELLKMSR
jgi:tetratricopeptide (TPR) repeat protein